MIKLLILSFIAFSSCVDINRDGCGRRLYEILGQPEPKIVGGFESQEGDFGWQISLEYNGNHNCGGVLVNNITLITAAHCVSSKLGRNVQILPYNVHTVVLGTHNLRNRDNNTVVRKVVNVKVHPEYGQTRFAHDIAVVKLDSAVEFSNYILPACIPESANNYAGKTGVASGYGRTGQFDPTSPILLEVKLPIQSAAKCSEAIAPYNKEVEICAGFEGGNVTTCAGDSGGPLHIKVEQSESNKTRGSWDVIGLTSYGYSDCLQGGVFAHVGYFYEWIKENI